MKRVNNRAWLGMAEKLLQTGQAIRLRVRGQSMRPFLREGSDEVILRPIYPNELCEGLVVLARIGQEPRYVLHRIVRMEGDEIYLHGDGNLGHYEHCPSAAILAIAESRIRDGNTRSLTSPQAIRQARLWHQLRPLRRVLLHFIR